ncbi:eight-cysteine-cluster domain-containing protein [Candidatus Woesearchaeota archaeon]|nr:eight-cysteine-cluster domain-containing protein [Candidatus Woesearchaeota archaeon]
MKTRLFVPALLVILLIVLGCAPVETPPKELPKTTNEPTQADYDAMLDCASDSDCICGGFDELKGRCYLGSKDYYDKFVNQSKDCPDFCTGIAGNLAVKCVDNKCMQMLACLSDADCAKGERCSQNRCISSAATTTPKGAECSTGSDCAKAGCSSELCLPASKAGDIASICLYRPEYDCLKLVSCGCENGKCAWSTSDDYETCVRAAQESGADLPQ